MYAHAVGKFWILIGCLPITWLALTHSSCGQQGADNYAHTTATILVLKNGQIVQGLLSRDASQVFVQSSNGSRLVFPVQAVDFVCRSLSEAYWQKNARIKATDLEGHVALFHWCLKYQLVKEAQNQIDLLQLMPIKATRLDYLNRQLTVANDQRRLTGQRMLAKTEMSQGKNSEPAAKADVRVQLVNFEEEISTTPDRERLVSIKKMEKAIDRLPKNSVAIFKRKVEPLLARNCYQCHKSEKSSLTLMRLGRNQVIPKRLSQRNLFAVLQHVDYERPLASPLFAAAVGPHADLEDPIIKPGTDAFDNLGRWLVMISRQPAAFHTIPDFSNPSTTADPSTDESDPKIAEIASEESGLLSVPAEDTATVPSIPELTPAKTQDQAGPTDPFDPGPYNKQLEQSSDSKDLNVPMTKTDAASVSKQPD